MPRQSSSHAPPRRAESAVAIGACAQSLRQLRVRLAVRRSRVKKLEVLHAGVKTSQRNLRTAAERDLAKLKAQRAAHAQRTAEQQAQAATEIKRKLTQVPQA